MNDWTRIDPCLKPGVDRIVFTTVENIGVGPARQLSVSIASPGSWGGVEMTPVYEPLLRAGASVPNVNQIVVRWSFIEGLPGSRSVRIRLTVQYRDSLNYLITSNRFLNVYEDWSTHLVGEKLTHGVGLGTQSSQVRSPLRLRLESLLAHWKSSTDASQLQPGAKPLVKKLLEKLPLVMLFLLLILFVIATAR
ncbi:MAG: hypothetical protein KDI29_11715 [Pseudomonadales bacterium]|nr:hypothetical protein [Pseudomonadales bacterium]